MLTGARTLLILVAVALLVIAFGGWGWGMLTRPFPKKEAAPICTRATVRAGDHVTPAEVTVSVLNASTRDGLATRTLSDLEKGGFAAGKADNAAHGTKVGDAQIWTEDASSPAAILLKAWVPSAKIVRTKVTAPGVLLVVGDKFGKVGAGPASITAKHDGTICSPVLS